MARKTKEEFKRKRKPSVFIVCEGRNKTERAYFNHFNERYAPYNLRIVNCGSTDITSMAQMANSIFVENDLDLAIGDRVYCLVDLDLEQHKYDKFIKAKSRYKKIKIIPSNPCFEIWLQYYFVKDPKVVNSSQKAKEELARIFPGYTESMDIVSVANWKNEQHVMAIQNSEKKNIHYDDGMSEVEKNPYTEVADVVCKLLNFSSED